MEDIFRVDVLWLWGRWRASDVYVYVCADGVYRQNKCEEEVGSGEKEMSNGRVVGSEQR